jgi:p-cumate 2,3-dioxygenase alpha subunit
MATQINDIDELVVDDVEHGLFRVHRSTMTSNQIFAQEQERIFHQCWIYIGHESEVEKPGDFVARTVLGHPLFLLKDQQGTVRCFYNTCPHRGAIVCREDKGNAKRFTCFYHAWTYDSTGRLIALPDEDGYGDDFDREERSLQSPPRLDIYRGFWFVSFNPNIESLDDYLADAKYYLDLVVDQAEDGMRIVHGSNQYSISTNWKLLIENSIDGYHAMPVHQTYFAYTKSLGGGIKTSSVLGAPRQLGNGHVVLEGEAPYGRPIARWDQLFGEDAKADIDSIRTRLFTTFGEERATKMCDNYRNLLVFPNLIVNDITAITVRYLDPVAPDVVNVSAWALAPREEQGDRLARRIDSYLTFIGPGGFATPDDVEALESCQKGFKARPDAGYSDISRGMTRIPEAMDELQMRAFWRAWAARMKDSPVPKIVELPETIARVAVRR